MILSLVFVMSYKSLPSVFTSGSIHTFLEMRSAANKRQICVRGKKVAANLLL